MPERQIVVPHGNTGGQAHVRDTPSMANPTNVFSFEAFHEDFKRRLLSGHDLQGTFGAYTDEDNYDDAPPPRGNRDTTIQTLERGQRKHPLV